LDGRQHVSRMEMPTRLQNVLPMYSERGAARIVAEMKSNPRSVPLVDDELPQWYRVGRVVSA
uniref:MOSC domain-containing protein n=1 Tax=Anisakis simplex TaxID=6269 RepID=A0A0M3JAS7_ANISI